jgi:hypothetical protein
MVDQYGWKRCQLWKRFLRNVNIKRERYTTEKALPALPKLVNDGGAAPS